MNRNVVIVRDFRGTPLRRVAQRAANGLIFVLCERVDSDSPPAIGCPETDVFAFDDHEFAALEAAWQKAGVVSDAQWARLKPYRP